MKIISFIENPSTIKKILKYLTLWDEERGPQLRKSSRDPPAHPEIPDEIVYVPVDDGWGQHENTDFVSQLFRNLKKRLFRRRISYIQNSKKKSKFRTIRQLVPVFLSKTKKSSIQNKIWLVSTLISRNDKKSRLTSKKQILIIGSSFHFFC